jgi:hypothetical protein
VHFVNGHVPFEQFGYPTEALSETGLLIGVAELLQLPSGQLLALERELVPGADGLSFNIALFEITTGSATDISGFPDLNGATFSPVEKKRLWHDTLPANFESMALSPELADGSFSLILLSEGGRFSGDSDGNAQIKVLKVSSAR